MESQGQIRRLLTAFRRLVTSLARAAIGAFAGMFLGIFAHIIFGRPNGPAFDQWFGRSMLIGGVLGAILGGAAGAIRIRGKAEAILRGAGIGAIVGVCLGFVVGSELGRVGLLAWRSFGIFLGLPSGALIGAILARYRFGVRLTLGEVGVWVAICALALAMVIPFIRP